PEHGEIGAKVDAGPTWSSDPSLHNDRNYQMVVAHGGVRYWVKKDQPVFNREFVIAFLATAGLVLTPAVLEFVVNPGGAAVAVPAVAAEAQRGGRDIALGMQRLGLDKFAESTKAAAMYMWEKLGLFDESAQSWGEAFRQAMSRTIEAGGRVHFNLTGLDIPRALA